MATRLRPLSQSMSHGGTGKIGKKVRSSSTNSVSCGLTLEGDRGQHNGMKGEQIGWPSGDSDRAASRGSECTSEEEDEFDNGEDEEKKDDCRGHSRPATPTLLGHEVMEERARFTVYKILVKPRPEESWVVFRRYTDFARLNDKLKETFPGFRLALPPKRWFKDNFDPVFLEHRQAGLQAFLQNLVAHKDVTNCIPVRDFLCLDEPPGPFDSLVESRAFCEGLEETNYQLQRELLDRQHEIDTLRVSLDLSTNRLAVMEGQLRELGVEPRLQIPSDRRGSSSEGEYSTVEADQSPTMAASSWPPIHHSPGCTGAHVELAESPQEQRVDEVEHHLGLDDSSSYEQAEEALALNE